MTLDHLAVIFKHEVQKLNCFDRRYLYIDHLYVFDGQVECALILQKGYSDHLMNIFKRIQDATNHILGPLEVEQITVSHDDDVRIIYYLSYDIKGSKMLSE